MDTHKSIPNRKYQKEQTARYLKRDRLMHRWYQSTLSQADEYEKNRLLIPGRGYRYRNAGGLEMVEMHVDEIPDYSLLTYINHECIFGGNLSIRRNPNERPVFSFGHDECIFHQFIFTNSAWKGTKGEQAPIPKDEGYGLMVSAFQSREFGLSMSLTANQLALINAFRNEKRPTYTEKESALKLKFSEAKNPLTNSPFHIFLNMVVVLGRRDTGHMIICPCSLKIAWTALPTCIQNMIVSGSLTTVVVMTEAGKMVCW